MDVAKRVLFDLPDPFHTRKDMIVLLRAIDHLSGQVVCLKNPVVVDHYGNNLNTLAVLVQAQESFEEPANRHVCIVLLVQLAGSESLAVLVNRCDLISANDFFKNGSIDVVAL